MSSVAGNDNIVNIPVHDSSIPILENVVHSPIVEQVSSKYKLKLRYKGFFKMVKNSNRRKYCFGSQKCIYMDTCSFDFNELNEEVLKRYPSHSNQVFSILFVDKYAQEQSFIQLNSDESFKIMLGMYEKEKEITIYVTTNKNLGTSNTQQSGQHEVIEEPQGEGNSDYYPSDESYFSHNSSDDDNDDNNDEEISNCEIESYSKTCSNRKKSSSMKIKTRFPNVIAFRTAMNHHAITNEFSYYTEKSDFERFTARCEHEECPWRIHASRLEDKVTFEVRKLVEKHACTRSNMGGNKHATQAWIASVVTDKLKFDGNATVGELRKWLMKKYNVNIPYNKVFRGKEQAYSEMYGKWEDSFLQMDEFKEELQKRNPGSVVDIDSEIIDGKKCFKRFFISLAACSKGFLSGCRPYISLDACHLKGKFNGVLAAATGIDGNNSIFPLAYSVLESENTNSWTWFLESVKKAIGTPEGLVISSDMQKGLASAIMQIYPTVEHRECIRHLYSNFKKTYRGDFFKSNLWCAANTYSIIEHDRFLKEIANKSEDAIKYLALNHNKIWSRSKFGTIAKCDYMTNNISEAFNSWIGACRYQPVLDLLDDIREKILKRFDEQRRIATTWNGTLVPMAKKYLISISKNLGEYEVCRSNDNHAEVKYKGKRWEVILDERKCSCRVWQVKGLSCVHAAAFIAFIRESWEKYVDPYFTIQKFKDAYAFEVATMPGRDQWMHLEKVEMMHPPVIKRPAGRPRKNRIVPEDESKKRRKCKKCHGFGHLQKTCKNPPVESSNLGETSTTKRRRRKNTKAQEGSAELGRDRKAQKDNYF